jgi:hypothetical protein
MVGLRRRLGKQRFGNAGQPVSSPMFMLDTASKMGSMKGSKTP